MVRRLIPILALPLLLLGAARTPAAMLPAAPAPQPAAEPPIPIPNLEARLEALSPDDPEAYFLLGEEVAAEIPVSPAARTLAQQLFVLAYELNRAAEGADPALTRSICLALASTIDAGEGSGQKATRAAAAASDRRWLLALARSLDADRVVPEFEAAPPGASRRDTALDVATVLGYARSGEGRRAEQLLQRPGVAEMLTQYEALLSAPGLETGAAAIRRYIAQWPNCPECRNRRAVTRPGEGGGTTTICYTCRGNPGPRLSDEEILLQLRLEAALLSGIQRSWAAQVSADSGAPLRDLDPSELAATFNIDPSRTLWRNGAWTWPAASAAPAPDPEPAPDADPPAPAPDNPEPAEAPSSTSTNRP